MLYIKNLEGEIYNMNQFKEKYTSGKANILWWHSKVQHDQLTIKDQKLIHYYTNSPTQLTQSHHTNQTAWHWIEAWHLCISTSLVPIPFGSYNHLPPKQRQYTFIPKWVVFSAFHILNLKSCFTHLYSLYLHCRQCNQPV